jgi:sugar phosphate isomerase/epimerase
MTAAPSVTSPGTGLSGLSINQATVQHTSLPDLLPLLQRAGLGGVGLWREPVEQLGAERVGGLVRDSGLAVTSLCRGGFFPATDAGERARRIEDNRRAIEQAARLGAEALVLVSGGLPAGTDDLDGAREMVADGIAALVDDARASGVRLAIEPLHPMFCADRCVVVTLGQALDLAELFPADAVGVVVDSYHIWWDPDVHRQILRAAERIFSFQISDWVTPLPEGVLMGRAMVGDGCIDLQRLHADVIRAGYTGAVEVEIFNDEIWRRPAEDVIDQTAQAYLKHLHQTR